MSDIVIGKDGNDWKKTAKKSAIVGAFSGLGAVLAYVTPLIPVGPWSPLVAVLSGMAAKAIQDYLSHS